MNKILIGAILLLAVIFLAFLVAIIVLAYMNKRPGQSFADASRATLSSGWRSFKSRLTGIQSSRADLAANDRDTRLHRIPAGLKRVGPAPRMQFRSGYDWPQTDPFDEMSDPGTEAKYYHVGPAPSARNATCSSYNRQAQPIVFPSSAFTPTPSTDLQGLPATGKVGSGDQPGYDAYETFAAEALSEDIDALSGSHLFGDRPLPASPLTDDQFRYTGDFEIPRGDPYLNTPMVKQNIGFSNRGVGLWTPL